MPEKEEKVEQGMWKMVMKANGHVDYVNIDQEEYREMYASDNRNSEKQQKKLEARIKEGAITDKARNCFTCDKGEMRSACRVRCKLFDLMLTPAHCCTEWSKRK